MLQLFIETDKEGGTATTRAMTQIKEKMTSYLKRSFTSVISMVTSTKSNAPPITVESSVADQDLESVSLGRVDTLGSIHDSKRKIIRVSLDPSSKLLALADSLGRVLLYDTRIGSIVRMWKGIRDARFAWTVGALSKTDTSHLALCLAIYAPQLGLLSLWVMKHGSCVRSIPLGPHCQIATVMEGIQGGPVR